MAAHLLGEAVRKTEPPAPKPNADGPDTNQSQATTPTPRKVSAWPIWFLALPAGVAIWSGWVGLGQMAGFGPVQLLPGITDVEVNTAITLPIGMEAYAAFALRAWLSGRVPANATKFAKWSAIGALFVGALGQVLYHLLESAGVTKAPWGVTVFVATLPVIVLGMGAALAHLINSEAEKSADSGPQPQTANAVEPPAPTTKPERTSSTQPGQAKPSGNTKSTPPANTTPKPSPAAPVSAPPAAKTTTPRLAPNPDPGRTPVLAENPASEGSAADSASTTMAFPPRNGVNIEHPSSGVMVTTNPASSASASTQSGETMPTDRNQHLLDGEDLPSIVFDETKDNTERVRALWHAHPGMTNVEIARALNVVPKTVKRCKDRILSDQEEPQVLA